MKKLFNCGLILFFIFCISHHYASGEIHPTMSIANAIIAIPYAWDNAVIKGGGFVSGIITHPTQPGLVYARTDVGGAYRLDTTSNRWIPLTDWVGKDDWSLTGIESIAVDPTDPNRVYLAAGMYPNWWTSLNGAILRSTDQGSTFQRFNLPFKMGGNWDGRSMGERLMVDPNKNNILFFGTRTSGLWMSLDYASTWSKVTSFPVTGDTTNFLGLSFVIFDAKSGTPGNATPKIYVGVATTSGNSLYRSLDCGTTWSAVSGQPANLMPHHAVFDANSTLYITFNNGSGPNGITSGAVWKYNTNSSVWTNITPPTGQGGFAGISLDTAHPGTVIVSTLDRWWPNDEMYRSTNSGTTWVEVWGQGATKKSIFNTSSAPYAASSNPHWIGDIEIDPFNPDRVYFITGYGIYRSNDITALNTNPNATTHWDFFNDGLEETVGLDLASPPSGAYLLSAVGDVDGFKHDSIHNSSPLGRFSPNMGTNRSIDFAQNTPNIVVRAGDTNGYGYYSLNGGTSWSVFTTVPSGTNGAGAISVSADGNRFVWAPSGAAMSYTITRGTTWTACTGGVNGQKPVADRVNAAKFYFYNTNNSSVYVSTNGGANFSQQATGLGNGSILRAVPGFEGDLWLPRNSSGLYRSTNSGTSFSNIASVQEAYQVGFGKASTGLTYPAIFLWCKVSNIVGYFISNDTGATWSRINDDAHQFAYSNAIAGDARIYGRIYLATSGRGIIYGEPVGTIPVTLSRFYFTQ